MSTHRSHRLGWLSVALLLGWTASAQAQAHRGRKDAVRWDLHLDLADYDFGVGFRADIPVARDGIIEGVNDELAISPGAELFFWNYRDSFVSLLPLVALQWNFYVGHEWSVFPELGIGLFYGRYYHSWYYNNRGDPYDSARFSAWPFLGVGARWHFSQQNALLMRITAGGLQVGITF